MDALARADDPGPRGTWRAARTWLAAHTFAPTWPAHPRSRSAAAGYLAALLLQGIAAALTLLLARLVPAFAFPGSLPLLAVVLVALTWGMGPSLLATVVGAVLADAFVLRSGGATHAAPGLGVTIFFCAVGVAAGIVGATAERHRRSAQAARGLAEEAQARMDTFVAMVSHELRSPLTTIKLSAQMLHARVQSLPTVSAPGAQPDALGPLVERIARQSTRMERLVADLLDATRLEGDRLEIRPARCDLAAIVREAVEAERAAWPTRTIRLHLPQGPLPIVADAGRIGQVVSNYLTNALKYSEDERAVDVCVRAEGGQARVAVRDDGPGLTPEQQARVWERFAQADGIAPRGGGGTGLGLGLYISRLLIAQHRGRVGVESAPGAGSTFWFTIPLAEPPGAGASTYTR